MVVGIIPLAPASPAVFHIDPLPDFLADHTLLDDTPAGRLQEHARRWTQMIRSLWTWQDATFALRYRFEPGWHTIQLTVQGTAAESEDQARLDDDLEMRFRDFGIALARWGAAPAPLESREEAYCYDVRQRIDRVWQPGAGRGPAHSQQLQLRNLESLPESDRTDPPVLIPWRGPGGTFQLPVKGLLSLGVPAEFTAYLTPARLEPHEREYLRYAAAEAEAKGRASGSAGGGTQQVSFADPAAAFAARLYLAQYRRLANPYLVVVRCAATTAAKAEALAATLQAVVSEPPLEPPDPDEDRVPPGAEKFGPRTGRQMRPFALGANDLSRLPYLADAAGAATVFRLPVSVNGGVPGIETRQRVPDFHPGPRVLQFDAKAKDPNPEKPQLDLGRFADGGVATMPLKDLTKHALVTGFTGSGKTVTVLRLLDQLWATHSKPFLVLESAKQEYRGLFGVPVFADNLRVYTLGNETAVPFRLNPFELLPGVRVEAHVGRLQVCFEGAIPPVGPSSSVIAEALVEVYNLRGWSITDSCPKDGPPRRAFPTLTDFVAVVERVIKERKYKGEVESNVTAAIVGRLRPLLLGSKKRMLDCLHSTPVAKELFGLPTVLEMNDLNADDKALVVMFLLTLLREYRELHPGPPDELAHVTVVEEAHNVLAAVKSAGTGEGAGADTKFKAVEAFCSLLTEVRALGEGLVIADQSPEKLAADAMRNTNLQIAHQLRDGHDRDAIANAMIMTDEQRDYLGKLTPGMAAMFRTGLERATFLQVPPYYPTNGLHPTTSADGTGFLRIMGVDALIARMEKLVPEVKNLRQPVLPFGGCEDCQSKCRYRDAMFADAQTAIALKDAAEYGRLAGELQPLQTLSFAAVAADRAAVRIEAEPGAEDARWCYYLHLRERGSPGQPLPPDSPHWTARRRFLSVLAFSRLPS